MRGRSWTARGLVGVAVLAALARAAPAEGTWRFAVISDLHSPRRGKPSERIERLVAQLVVLHPRFVVVEGDSTNGNRRDGRRTLAQVPAWWQRLRAELAPLTEHGIPVLPIAGNHDSYLPAHRAAYMQAFHDLGQLAAPLVIRGPFAEDPSQIDRAPFSYSVDVDGVHLCFAHIPWRDRQPSRVDGWLAHDLAAAASARFRFVFGHAPIASVLLGEDRVYRKPLGAALVAGHADVYFAGHEHTVWDENVSAPGGMIRQVLVGVAGSSISYGPGHKRQHAAGCHGSGRFRRSCRMPNGDYPFTLVLTDEQRTRRWPPPRARAIHQDVEKRALPAPLPPVLRWVDAHAQTFTIVEVGPDGFHVEPWAIGDDGALVPFRDQ
jgi:predicted phosphodiesterase